MYDYKVKVVNLSAGLEGCWAHNRQAEVNVLIDRIMAQGVHVVVAAGNSFINGGVSKKCWFVDLGARYGVHLVGASVMPSNTGWSLAKFSGFGPTSDGLLRPTITAPGLDVTVADSATTNAYKTVGGTSVSAPFVAGVIAGVLDANYSVTNYAMLDIISNSYQALRIGGYNNAFGGGLIRPLESYKTQIPSTSTWDLTRSIISVPNRCDATSGSGFARSLSFNVNTTANIVIGTVISNSTYDRVLTAGYYATPRIKVWGPSNRLLYNNVLDPIYTGWLNTVTIGLDSLNPATLGAHTVEVSIDSVTGTPPAEGICWFYSVSYK